MDPVKRSLTVAALVAACLTARAVQSPPWWLWQGAADDGLPTVVTHYACEDDASSSTVTDSAGSNTGTLVNDQNNYSSEQSIDGKIGKAFEFDGSSDYVTDTTASGLSGDTGTMSFWAYIDAHPAVTEYMLELYKDANNVIRIFYGSGTSQYRFQFKTGGSSYFSDVTESDVPTGEWVWFCFTWDDTGSSYAYINNVQKDTASLAAFPGPPTKIYFATDHATMLHFDGGMDEVKIGATVWTADERLAEYTRP